MITSKRIDEVLSRMESEEDFWVETPLSVEKKEYLVQTLGTDDSYEDIRDTLSRVHGIYSPDEYRVCNVCGKRMLDGCVYGTEYLCESCRHKRFPDEVWDKMYEEAEEEDEAQEDVYWTQWAEH